METKVLNNESAELTVENVKKLIKAINSVQNSWAYYLEDYENRYSFYVKRGIIEKHITQYRGIYYTRSISVELNDQQLVEWFNKYKYLLIK